MNEAKHTPDAIRTDPHLLEAFAVRSGMVSLLNHGAASCVYSEGCQGVTQEHLTRFCEIVAAYCVEAMRDMLVVDHRESAAALSTPPAQAPVAEVVSWTNGSYSRNYTLRWFRDVPEGAKLYAEPALAQADALDAARLIERIARQWDGCYFDALGGDIDIGEEIRAAATRIQAEGAARATPEAK